MSDLFKMTTYKEPQQPVPNSHDGYVNVGTFLLFIIIDNKKVLGENNEQ